MKTTALGRWVVGAGVLALLAGGAAAARTLPDILASGTIRVAVPEDFPPFGSIGADFEVEGYDIDTANLIADELGVALELVPVTSANRVPFLQTDRVDLIVSSLGKNDEREEVIDFTAAYAPFFSGVFGPEDVAVGSADDLSGYTVGVTRGSVEDLALSEMVPADATVSRYEDNNTTISAFISGQVELVATGNVVAAAISERAPARQPTPKFLIENSPCYIGVQQGNDGLRARVNEIILASREDGRLDDISLQWLGQPLPDDLPG